MVETSRNNEETSFFFVIVSLITSVININLILIIIE